MLMWITIIIGFLEMLLQWLQSNPTPTPAQVKALNHLIAKNEKVKKLAVPLGCNPNGDDSV